METKKYEQGNRVENAVRVKQALKSAKVGVMGVLRDPEYCEKLIEDGKVDYVSLGRALLCDPEWPKKAYEGREDQIRPCLSCLDGCMGGIAANLSFRCVLNPMVGREFRLGDMKPAEQAKRILVIGGISGLQAAMTAAERGHDVILAEKSGDLGGQMNLAALPPYKQRVAAARDWYVREDERLGVKFLLNTDVTAELVKELNPELVIAATGAEPITDLPIRGLDLALPAWDLIRGDLPMPENQEVTIIGGGIVGCEIMEMLVEKGNKVTIMEMLPAIASGMEGLNLMDLYGLIQASGVNVLTGATAQSIDDDGVVYEQGGERLQQKADTVILAAGQKSAGSEVIGQIRDAGYEVRVTGDGKKPRKFIDATREGFFAAYDA